MTPIIYPREESGLRPPGGIVKPWLFGELGEVQYVTFHHTAGPRAETKAEAQALNRQYQLAHINKGWGDYAYHLTVDDLGRGYECRPWKAKGAHTALHNSRNIGISFHGDYTWMGLTVEQREFMRWLFQGGFYYLFREPEDGIADVRGHKDWPDNFTACPGTNLYRHLNWLKSVETF